MKLVGIILKIVIVIAICIIIVSSLARSTFQSIPFEECLNWQMWVTFFTFSMWIEKEYNGINNRLDEIGKELKSEAE